MRNGTTFAVRKQGGLSSASRSENRWNRTCLSGYNTIMSGIVEGDTDE